MLVERLLKASLHIFANSFLCNRTSSKLGWGGVKGTELKSLSMTKIEMTLRDSVHGGS